MTATVLPPFRLCTAELKEGPGGCCSPSTSMASGSPFAELETAPPTTGFGGPNKGYGFASGGTPNRSVEEHRESIRVFLAMIDPNTGYIGEDGGEP